ncbi:hypothetical protein ABTX81_01390 [Kitasatospora sp. NPDC097605]|uniref:terpene synthase family protein n=1 Tax=Kitasatospora sp. NPDC097605 TaxID=3157226 RepID=UPI00331C6133
MSHPPTNPNALSSPQAHGHIVDFGIQDVFRLRVHPCAEEAVARHRHWARGIGLISDVPTADAYPANRYELIGPDYLSAMCFRETAVDDLVLSMDWMGWTMVYDDRFDGPANRDPATATRTMTRMLSVLHHGLDGVPPPHHPTETAFADIWARECEGMSPAWKARAATDQQSFIAAFVPEILARRRGHCYGVKGYYAVRRATSAMQSVIDLIERVGRFEVPPSAFQSPELLLIRRATADISALTNDVNSLAKEEEQGDVCNLVIVLRTEGGMSRDDAVAEVRRRVDECVHTITAMEERLPDLCTSLGLDRTGRDAVRHYVQGMKDYTAGFTQWEMRTPRYAGS